MWLDLLTAGLYYMPFVVTIAFAGLVFLIGVLAFLSGTFVVLLLALYGSYAALRDLGLLRRLGDAGRSLWRQTSEPVVKNLQDSFVLRGSDLIPKTPALYLCFPHGLVGYTWFFHFSYGLSDWPTERPVLAIHSIFFRIPFVREILEVFRCIEASDAEIQRVLQSGTSVAIVLGGVEEMTHAGQTTTGIVLKKRKGYARIAKKIGVPLVPLYTHGENELFQAESNPLWNSISSWIYSTTGVTFPLPTWDSMKAFAKTIRAPLDPPIQTFVVGVLDTHQKDELTLRKECVQMLQSFFKKESIQARIVA